jgi:hypothetical protein
MNWRRLIPGSWRVHAIASLRAHHRGLMWTLEAIGFVLAGVAILLAVAAFRLERGPLELKFLTPQLVAWLDHQVAPLQVTVDDTSLHWSAGDAALEIYVAGVTLIDKTGDVIASVPSVGFSLSLRALALGRMRPLVVTIEAPSIRLQRAPAGNFYLRPGPAPPPSRSISLPELLGALAAWAKPQQTGSDPNHNLRRIVLRDGTIWVDDGHAGKNWHLSHLGIDITRSVPNYVALVHADIDADTDHAHVAATVGYNVETLQGRYRVTVDPVVPAHWAPLMSGPATHAAALDFPVGATLQGGVDLANSRLSPVAFTADAGSGQILDPHLDHGRYAFKKASLKGRFDPNIGRLDLDHIAFDLGGPTAAATITLTQIGLATPTVPMQLGLDLAIHDVPRQGMEGYWPPVPVPKTRGWVLEHVTAGRLADMTLKAQWEIYPGAPRPFVKKQMDGTLRFEGVTLDYLHGLAPAVGLNATAKLAIDHIDFDAAKASILGFTLRHGTASIDGLDKPDAPSNMTVNLDLAGPARDGLTFVSAPRLHLADKIGIRPDDVSGEAEGPIQVRFPIMKTGDTQADAVQYQANVHVTHAGVIKGALGRDISDGDVSLAVDNRHIVIAGAAEIATVPARFTWEDVFATSPAVRMRLHLEADAVDDSGRAHLQIDPLPGAVKGPVAVVADATVDRNAVTRALIHLDFAHAALFLPDANWTKPVGPPANLVMTGWLKDGRWRKIRGLDARGPDLDIQGDLDFDSTGAISRAVSDDVAIGATDAAADISHDADGWHVLLDGPAIDATGYVSRFDRQSTPEERAAAPPVAISLKTDRLTLGPERVMRAARFVGKFDHLALQEGDLGAQIGRHGKLAFHLDLPEAGGAIRASTDDMGEAMRVLSLSGHVAGGAATLIGQCVRTNGLRHFTAKLEGSDYRLVQAPIFAKILSLASFTSIASLVYGDGVPFKSLSADLALTDGTMTIDHGRAFGDAIGLVADGSYDFNTKNIDLRGTLVPAYFLNGILGDLPLVGKFLAGGTGQGLFGANFRVGGPIASPSITANPLSILAPGPLRELFLFQAPRPSGGNAPAKPNAGGAP